MFKALSSEYKVHLFFIYIRCISLLLFYFYKVHLSFFFSLRCISLLLFYFLGFFWSQASHTKD
jgi:hypothetical protein